MMARLSQLALVALAGLMPVVEAVHYFTGLDSHRAVEMVGLTDANGVVVKNTLISFSNKQCIDQLYAVGFPFDYIDLPGVVHELANVLVETPGNELMDFFGVKDCQPFVYYPAGSRWADKGFKITPNSQEELESWFWDFQRLPDVRFINDLDRTVNVLWESRDGHFTERSVMVLQPGEEEGVGSFLGHTFVFRDTNSEEHVLLARAALVDDKPLLLSELLAGPEETEAVQRSEQTVQNWRGRRSTNKSRLRQNERQPPTVKTYTDVGFKKMRMPAILHKKLLEFQETNEAKRSEESWQQDDLHVNFFDVMTTTVHVNEEMRQLVFNTMQPILEAWVGGEKLEGTSTYGIRRYYEGSILRDHVDIGQTHIVSAILNVAQDTDKSWPLQILDSQGRRQFIDMAAGDMCLYESATSVHGRAQPFQGKTYDNIFTHFRPLSPFHTEGAIPYSEEVYFEDRPQHYEPEDLSEEVTDGWVGMEESFVQEM